MDILDALINGPKPVAIPSPVAPYAGALTLGDLAAKTGTGLLNLRVAQQRLAALSDPRVIALISGMYADMAGAAGNGAAGVPTGVGGMGVPGVSASDLQGAFSAFPLAMPGLLQQQIEVQKNLSDIQKNRATASKDYQDVRKTGINIVGNQANYIATKDGDITPMDDAMLVSQALHVGTPREVLLARPPITDQVAYRNWASSLSAAAADPKSQADIWSTYAKTPADIQKTMVETGLLPYNAQTSRMNAVTDANKFLYGTTGIGTNGQPYQLQPSALGDPTAVVRAPAVAGAAPTPAPALPSVAPSMAAILRATVSDPATAEALARSAAAAGQNVDISVPPPGGAAPVGAPAAATAPASPLGRPGTVPQLNLTPAQDASAREAGQEVGNLQARKSSAIQLQQQLLSMRDLDQHGIYSGGLWGTEGAKKLINVLGGLGYLSKDQVAKLQNTQVFDAESQQVIADAVSQFAGSRVAARELPFFAGTKPTTQQLAASRHLLYGELWDRAQRVIDQADQASSYMSTPDATTGRMPIDLGGFVPKFSNRGMPTISATPSNGIDIGGGMMMRPAR